MKVVGKQLSKEHHEKIRRHRLAIKSYRAKADAHRTVGERFADWLSKYFGSVTFLIINLLWFLLWFLINLGLLPGIEPFDPYPFGFLTVVVSLEAIFLAIIVLISQNRAARIAEVREEVDLYVNTISEEEISKVMQLLLLLLEKNGVDVSKDEEIQSMLKPLNSREIEKLLEKQLA